MSRRSTSVAVPRTFTPAFWTEADQRTAVVREIRRRVDLLKTEAGATSRQREILCERAAFIEICLETAEREAVETGKFDAGVYTQQVNALLGLLKSLGLDRKTKKVEDLATVLREHRRK